MISRKGISGLREEFLIFPTSKNAWVPFGGGGENPKRSLSFSPPLHGWALFSHKQPHPLQKKIENTATTRVFLHETEDKF